MLRIKYLHRGYILILFAKRDLLTELESSLLKYNLKGEISTVERKTQNQNDCKGKTTHAYLI